MTTDWRELEMKLRIEPYVRLPVGGLHSHVPAVVCNEIEENRRGR